MSSFGIYELGFIVVVIGVAIAAYLLGAPPVWIGVGAIILIGIGILSGVKRTRGPDRSPHDTPRTRSTGETEARREEAPPRRTEEAPRRDDAPPRRGEEPRT